MGAADRKTAPQVGDPTVSVGHHESGEGCLLVNSGASSKICANDYHSSSTRTSAPLTHRNNNIPSPEARRVAAQHAFCLQHFCGSRFSFPRVGPQTRQSHHQQQQSANTNMHRFFSTKLLTFESCMWTVGVFRSVQSLWTSPRHSHQLQTTKKEKCENPSVAQHLL